MNQSKPLHSLSGRSVGGVFAGVVLGSLAELLAQVLFFWDGPSESGFKLPVVGGLVGGLLIGSFAVCVGARALPLWFKHSAIGILTGLVIGVLGGALVYAPIMTSIELGQVFRGKVFALYQVVGILFGALIGSVAGLVEGAALWLYKLRKSQGNSGGGK